MRDPMVNSPQHPWCLCFANNSVGCDPFSWICLDISSGKERKKKAEEKKERKKNSLFILVNHLLFIKILSK